jgi:hypothetical protein
MSLYDNTLLPKSLGGQIAVLIAAFVAAIIAFWDITNRGRPSPAESTWTSRPQGNPREQEDIDAIVALGGTVEFSQDDPEKLVSSVHLRPSGKPLNDALAILRRFGKLKTLTLSGPWVTDADLKDVKDLTQLTTLSLWNNGVTDAGLKELQALPQLATLNLGRTDVTDAGLKELQGLPQLTTLDLRGTDVTDAGLKELQGLPQLTTLDLRGTDVTERGVRALEKDLPNCHIVRVSGTFPIMYQPITPPKIPPPPHGPLYPFLP